MGISGTGKQAPTSQASVYSSGANSESMVHKTTAELVQQAMVQNGISDTADLSDLSKAEFQAILKSLQELAKQPPPSAELGQIVKSLDKALNNWNAPKGTALDLKISENEGRISALLALQSGLGAGSTGVADQISTALTNNQGDTSLLKNVQNRLNEEISLVGDDEASVSKFVTALGVDLAALEAAGISLVDLKLDGLKNELGNITALEGSADPLEMKRALVVALTTYLDVNKVADDSPLRRQADAMELGLEVTAEENDLKGAWLDRSKEVKITGDVTLESLTEVIEELKLFKTAALQKADGPAQIMIQAKLDAYRNAHRAMENGSSPDIKIKIKLFTELQATEMMAFDTMITDLGHAKEEASRAGNKELEGRLEKRIQGLSAEKTAQERFFESVLGYLKSFLDTAGNEMAKAYSS